MKKLKFLVPILGLALLLAPGTMYATDTGIDKNSHQVEVADALHSGAVELVNVEHYKLTDAEYKSAVLTKSSFGSVTYFIVFGLLASLVASFTGFFRQVRRYFNTNRVAFTRLAFGLTALAFALYPPAGVLMAFTLPAGVNFDQHIKGLKEQRAAKASDMQKMLDAAKKEERDFNEDEQKRYDKLIAERRNLKSELDLAEEAYEEERKKPSVPIPGARGDEDGLSKQDEKDLSKFSLMRSIQAQIPNSGVKLDGIESEMHQEALKEARASGIKLEGNVAIPHLLLRSRTLAPVYKRDVTATGQTSTAGDQGGDLIQTTKMGFIDVFRNKLVLAGLGARFLSGLQGNISMPRKTSGVTGAHKTENADSDEGTILFDTVEMSPNRLPHYVEYSKQLMLQSSQDVERMVSDDVIKNLAVLLEYFAINGSGSNNQPTGILNFSNIGSVVGGANGAAPDRDDVIDLETAVAVDNADIGSLAYLTNTKVRGKLKKTKTDTGSGIFVWQGGNELNGYNVGVSNNVPSDLDKGNSTGVCSALIFGNFNELVIGQWGGLDIVVDPYSQAKKGLIGLSAAIYYDVAGLHDESFAAMKDALTS